MPQYSDTTAKRLLALAREDIKELQAEIEKLKARITELEPDE